MRGLLFSFFFLFLVYKAEAQTYTQTIRGTVTDADSKSPLPGAGLMLSTSDSSFITVSDANGKFRFEKAPLGRHVLKASFMGYEDAVLSNVLVSSGKEVLLNIELKERSITTEVIEIVAEKDKTKANNELVTLSSRNFRAEETERYAGSRGDPSKMVANYAGVATGNDARNDIIVRGNSPLGVLWRLEGVDIPNPNHFSAQGATGGPVSILNNNVLANSDFLTGAFPAEYGNKMAAVFDLKLRNGNNEKPEYTAQLGFNGLEAGIEGPISKDRGSSFLVNYRYSTLKIFQELGISFGVSATPKYQDLSFKFNFPTAKAGIFTVWGIGGISNISLLDSEKDSTDWSFTSSGQDLIFRTSMGATGISHLYFFNSNTSGKLSFSAGGTNFGIRIDTLTPALDKFKVFHNTSIDRHEIISYTINSKINARHLIKAGMNYNQLHFDYFSQYYSRYDKLYRDLLNENGTSGILQSFIHHQYKPLDNLTLNTGLHYQNFLLNNSQAIEPRAGIKWQFKPKQSLSFGYGMHSQTQPLIYYFFTTYNGDMNLYDRSNKHLDLTKSHHFISAYDLNLNKDFRFKTEAYYQSLYNVPVEKNNITSFSMINVGADLEGIPLVDSLENKGTGTNCGIEFTLEKFFGNNYYFLLTSTLYEAKYKGSDKIERHSAFSGGYIFNALGGVEYKLGKGNSILAFDGKATVAGGNRYTPVNIDESVKQKKAIYIDEEAFSKKFKPYSKVDLKISLKLNKRRSTQIIFINVENVFNTKNIVRQVFNGAENKIINEYQLGLFPYGGYRIEF